ncbi:uncharacterized protein LOC135688777 isoform X2 [Rhopilema esculentum]|eukprot:gene7677-13500_t
MPERSIGTKSAALTRGQLGQLANGYIINRPIDCEVIALAADASLLTSLKNWKLENGKSILTTPGSAGNEKPVQMPKLMKSTLSSLATLDAKEAGGLNIGIRQSPSECKRSSLESLKSSPQLLKQSLSSLVLGQNIETKGNGSVAGLATSSENLNSTQTESLLKPQRPECVLQPSLKTLNDISCSNAGSIRTPPVNSLGSSHASSQGLESLMRASLSKLGDSKQAKETSSLSSLMTAQEPASRDLSSLMKSSLKSLGAAQLGKAQGSDNHGSLISSPNAVATERKSHEITGNLQLLNNSSLIGGELEHIKRHCKTPITVGKLGDKLGENQHKLSNFPNYISGESLRGSQSVFKSNNTASFRSEDSQKTNSHDLNALMKTSLGTLGAPTLLDTVKVKQGPVSLNKDRADATEGSHGTSSLESSRSMTEQEGSSPSLSELASNDLQSFGSRQAKTAGIFPLKNGLIAGKEAKGRDMIDELILQDPSKKQQNDVCMSSLQNDVTNINTISAASESKRDSSLETDAQTIQSQTSVPKPPPGLTRQALSAKQANALIDSSGPTNAIEQPMDWDMTFPLSLEKSVKKLTKCHQIHLHTQDSTQGFSDHSKTFHANSPLEENLPPIKRFGLKRQSSAFGKALGSQCAPSSKIPRVDKTVTLFTLPYVNDLKSIFRDTQKPSFFNFSTPSPDDIVRSKQNNAFKAKGSMGFGSQRKAYPVVS